MEVGALKAIIESLIFVSEEPLKVSAMLAALDGSGVEREDIETALAALKADTTDNSDRALALIEVAGGYQFRTKSDMSPWISKLNVPRSIRLSQAAMETMAIVAYQQPITRSEIEDIRGVDCGGVLKTLLERELIRIVGKRDDVGNPLIYGTTPEFMSVFNLKSLKDLPTLRELEDLSDPRSTAGARIGPVPSEMPAQSSLLDGLVDPGKDEEIRIQSELEDQRVIRDLEDELGDLRSLESSLFPKPKETFTIIPDPNFISDSNEMEVANGGTTEDATATADRAENNS